MFKRDVAVHLAERNSPRRVRLDRRIHDRAEALKAAHAVLELLDKVDDAVDRVSEDVDIDEECRKAAGRDLPVDAEEPAGHQREQLENVEHEGRTAVELRHRVQRAAAHGDIVVGHGGELLFLVVLRDIRLGDAHTGQTVFYSGVDDGVLHAHGAELFAHLLAHVHGKDDHHRDEREDDDREPQIDLRHQDERADQQHNREEQILRPVVRQLRHVEQVADDARDQRAGLVVVKIGKRQPLDVVKQVAAHVRLHIGRHAVAVVLDERVHQLFEEIEHHQHGGKDQDGAHILRRDEIIDDDAGQFRIKQVAERHAERAEHVQAEQPDIRLVVRAKALDSLHSLPPCVNIAIIYEVAGEVNSKNRFQRGGA